MLRQNIGKDGHMTGRKPRGTYGGRNEVRRIAKQIAVEIEDVWPGSHVTVDLDTVDDEDAYLWITPADSTFSEKVAFTALELVNSLGAQHGFWMVPRVLNDNAAVDPTHRLRIRTQTEQKATTT